MNSRFGSGRMTNDCGSTMCSTSPPGCTGSSSRAIPAISTPREVGGGQRAEVLAQRRRERRPDQVGPQRAVEQLARAPRGTSSTSVEQLVQVEHLDVVRAQRLGELVVLLLRALEPRHAVEQQVVVVARRQPRQLGPGPVQHDRPQPPDLAPDAVLVLTDAPDGIGHNAVLLAFLARRLLFAAVALVAVTVIVYVDVRRPARLERVFFHLDFGVTCSYPGCPAITELWGRTWQADVYLLLGGLVLGVTAGLAAAVFCATRPRTLAARAIETLALILYSMPVYLFGLGLLLLFEPNFGLLPSPVFFHPQDYAAPLENPWRFFEAMLVPWILVAAPFGAVVMRLARAAILEEIDSDYVRTAAAKGLPQRRGDAPARGTRELRLGGVAGRRVGADVRDQHGAGRVRVLHPRLPRPVEARVRPGASHRWCPMSHSATSTSRWCKRSRCGRRC